MWFLESPHFPGGFTYDGFDRLSTAQQLNGTVCPTAKGTATYAYDGLDRQISHQDAGATSPVKIHYDGMGSGILAEVPSSGTTEYATGPGGQPMGLKETSGTVQNLTTDGNGNVGTVSAGGAVTCGTRYDPFGITTSVGGLTACSTSNTQDDFFYRSARQDPTTGQYQMGSRTYDPSKGGFLTPDTFRTGLPTAVPAAGVDPLTANTYAYVNGDPVNLIDPTGHGPMCTKGPDCEDLGATPSSSGGNESGQDAAARAPGHTNKRAYSDAAYRPGPSAGIVTPWLAAAGGAFDYAPNSDAANAFATATTATQDQEFLRILNQITEILQGPAGKTNNVFLYEGSVSGEPGMVAYVAGNYDPKVYERLLRTLLNEGVTVERVPADYHAEVWAAKTKASEGLGPARNLMSTHQFCGPVCANAATEVADNGEVFKSGENGYITRNDGTRLHLSASDAQYINMKFRLQDDINELRDVLYFQETGSSRGPESEGSSGENAGSAAFSGTDDESDR